MNAVPLDIAATAARAAKTQDQRLQRDRLELLARQIGRLSALTSGVTA